MYGVIRIGTWRNEEARRRVGGRGKLGDRIYRKVLTVFGYVERRSEDKLTKIMYEHDVKYRKERGRPCTK